MADKHAYGFEARKVAKKVDEAEEGKVYRHKGTYGTEYDPSGKAKAAEPAKRGRGRPRKDAGTDGEVKKYDWSAFGGKVSIPAHKGKVTKHKMAGESAIKENVLGAVGPQGPVKPGSQMLLGDVLNDDDLFNLEQIGFQWGSDPADLNRLNSYLNRGIRRGAWWAQPVNGKRLRALAISPTDHDAMVAWSHNINLATGLS